MGSEMVISSIYCECAYLYPVLLHCKHDVCFMFYVFLLQFCCDVSPMLQSYILCVCVCWGSILFFLQMYLVMILQTNSDLFPVYSVAQESELLPDKTSQNGELKTVPSTQMIRSHSATGSLHAPQLNPIAADILRKEPEHETFSKINITAVGMDHFYPFIYLIQSFVSKTVLLCSLVFFS